ncbi:MAG: ANTAR domain-containing protein [Oscillospiraceae bacterium]|nr:ANTAR domain-containing protein [Oscillospiraceae bacterium]
MLDKICLSAGEYGFEKVTVSDSSNAAALFTPPPSLVFINAPLENEFGLDLAVTASGYGCEVIIAVPQKICEDVSAKIGSRSIFVLPKPLNNALIKQVFRFVMLSKASSDVLKTEKEQLETKLRDMRLVDRAKCTLMQYLRISEAEAHRQIQKRAMDMRLSQAEVAQDILKTYEM